MAQIYVRSTDGLDTDDGSTWALAKASLVGASAIDGINDSINVSQAHAESTTGAITFPFAGTLAGPVRVICVNDAAAPPTAAATTGTVTSTSNIIIQGCAYISGLTFAAGNTASSAQSLIIANSTSNNITFEDCNLKLMTGVGGLPQIVFGDETRSDASRVWLRDTNVFTNAPLSRLKVGCHFKWEGGSFMAGTAAQTSVFLAGTRIGGEFLVSNVDFTNIGTAFNLIERPTGGAGMLAKFRNIILPNGWAGSLWNSLPAQPGIRAEMYNSFAGTLKYRIWVADYAGTGRDDTVVVRTGGATDNTVPFSLKMTTSPDSKYPLIPFEGSAIKAFVNSTASTTLTFEIVHDSQGKGTASALQNDEFGVKVSYPGGFIDTLKADVLATSSDLTSSSVAWTTTGLTTPVKQKISVTFTPTSKGEVVITPVLFTPSKVVYICPLVS